MIQAELGVASSARKRAKVDTNPRAMMFHEGADLFPSSIWWNVMTWNYRCREMENLRL